MSCVTRVVCIGTPILRGSVPRLGRVCLGLELGRRILRSPMRRLGEGDSGTAMSLRVVVWNANMAVHRKLDLLVESLRPDIAIIPECATEDVLRRKGGLLLPDFSMAWVGTNPNKGLGVFGFGEYSA